MVVVAGRGRVPKPPAARVRRNAVPAPPPPVLPPGAPAAGPDLPAGDWHERTLAWWEAARRSPAAPLWTASDWEFAVLTAHLVQRLWAGGETRLAAEVRLREDRLALTLDGRRRLYLPDTPGADGGAGAGERPRKRAERALPVDDRRARLRVVDTG